ncbi:MAG: zinc ribbon domain-containing protein [Gammaproteobacteria bacterium]|nr:zinc ribbon domain-containing protein [Gammaproteobacteria bacterium]
MPIYEYECRACGHGFEVMQKMSDPVLVDCPDCAQSTLKKLISPVAFRLKGTGWYETDFKNSQRTKDTSNQPKANGSEADKNSKKEDELSSKSVNTTEDGGSAKSLDSSERSDSPKA